MATKEKAKPNPKTTEEGISRRKSAAELVRLRNHFYRDSYRLLILVVVGLILLAALMGYMVYYLNSHKPPPQYFATNVLGGVVSLEPLSSPTLSDAQLIDWASRAAAAIFTLNYVQYQEQLEQTKNTYFTADGGDQFFGAIKSSLNLESIKAGGYVVTAMVKQAPVILKKGLINEKGTPTYAWLVDVPIRVTWQNNANTRSYNLDVRLTILRNTVILDPVARKMNLDSLQGVGVAQVIALGGSGATAPLGG